MRIFPILLASSLTAAIAQATNPHCLSDQEASALIEGFSHLLTNTQANFNVTLAKQILASDWQASSDGVDYVRELPVRPDSPLFFLILPSKLHFAPAPSSSLLTRRGSLIDSIIFCAARVYDNYFQTGIHRPATFGTAVSERDNDEHLSRLQRHHLAIPAQHDSVAGQGHHHFYC